MSSNLIPQVTLREASLEDWKAIVAIEEANFSTEAAGAETIQKWIEQGQTNFLIAELNEKIAGYLVGAAVFSRHLTKEMIDNSSKWQQDSDFITIQRLSIHPDFKEQGLGTLLLAACKEIAVAFIILWRPKLGILNSPNSCPRKETLKLEPVVERSKS